MVSSLRQPDEVMVLPSCKTNMLLTQVINQFTKNNLHDVFLISRQILAYTLNHVKLPYFFMYLSRLQSKDYVIFYDSFSPI